MFIAYSYADASSSKAADLVDDGQVIDLKQEKYLELFEELQKEHGYSKAELSQIFDGVVIQKKVLELMDKQWEAKPYYDYKPLFVTPNVIRQGREKLVEHKELLDKIEKELGVDREVVIAIWGIETRFGTYLGNYNVFQTLNTLFDAYPRRSTFFRNQLVHFLLLCRENGMDIHSIMGSYAGAFGQTQFIPSSFREYAVSFDGDKQRDVFGSIDDILASIANYLKRYHWQLHAPIYIDIGTQLKSQELISANLKGRRGRVDYQTVSSAQGVPLPAPGKGKEVSIVGLEVHPDKGGGFRYVAGYPNFHAITAWNHSNRYAMAVTELAEALR
ncbi:MAG: lytic murein transglycosylase [Desulfopila sp.]|jgi:membrane-bound lytic murein transglycosylase B|nr:lytic murein transglycosylase [Desulfopila sp.]